jgi:hypothetical protein
MTTAEQVRVGVRHPLEPLHPDTRAGLLELRADERRSPHLFQISRLK